MHLGVKDLDLIFIYNNNFNETRTKIARQAPKSFFIIYKNMGNHQYIPIDLYLKLFNAMLEAILLYESENMGL